MMKKKEKSTDSDDSDDFADAEWPFVVKDEEGKRNWLCPIERRK